MDNRYEIRAKIGQGGLGAVYRAYDSRMNREVAIKRISKCSTDLELEEESTRQLIQEVAALASLQHPNIVTIYDVGTDEEGPYLVLELIGGRTIDALIEKRPLSWLDFRDMAVQVQEALIAAHDLNFLHSDIKPSNLMLSRLPSGNLQVKILDFGLSKLVQSQSREELESLESIFGSVHFMPPEQFERQPLDFRSDIYSMGCVFYYALTGVHPFEGPSAEDVMHAHMNHEVKPLHHVRAGIPLWACDWIMRQIKRKPEDRPGSIRESFSFFLTTDKNPNPTMSQGIDPSSDSPERPRLVFPGLVFPGSKPESANPAEEEAAKAPAPVESPAPAAPPAPVETTPPPAAPPPAPTPPPVEPPAATQAPAATEPESNPANNPKSPGLGGRAPRLITSRFKGKAPVPIPQPAPEPTPEPAPKEEPAPAAAPQPQAAEQQPAETKPESPSTDNQDSQKNQQQVPDPSLRITKRLLIPKAQKKSEPATDSKPAEPNATEKKDTDAKPAPQAAQADRKPRFSPLKAAAILIVLAVLGIGGWLAMTAVRRNADAKLYAEILAQAAKPETQQIQVDSHKLEVLLDSCSTPGSATDKDMVFTALKLAKSTDKTDLDAEILKFTTSEELAEDVRNALIRNVLGKRNQASVITPLIDYAKQTEVPSTVAACMESVRPMATASHVDAILEILQNTTAPPVRTAAEETLVQIVRKNEKPASMTPRFATIYQNSKDDAISHSMLRICGACGGPQALGIIKTALASQELKARLAATGALFNWPDDSAYPVLVESLTYDTDTTLRDKALDAIINMCSDKPGVPQPAVRKDQWTQIRKVAKGRLEQSKVIRALASKFTDDWAVSLLEDFCNEDDEIVAELALKGLSGLRERKAGK